MLKELLNVAIKASLEAGDEIMKIYNRDYAVDYKKDQSPLTEADIASNQVINSYLEQTNIPIISEENKQLDYSERKKWSRCWIVDPLDGTKEFIKKNDEFTVNIALVENGITVLGVIFAPALKELYYTDATKFNAYKLHVENSEQYEDKLFHEQDKLIPSPDNKDLVNIVASRSHIDDTTLNFINTLKSKYDTVNIVSKGSSLKFCLVANGKADIYPRFAPTMEWDTAAGQAICEAVGLQVIDMTTNKKMFYNRQNLLNNHFLVTKND
ncbi:3'(2'),5'-bisphosphate nucleotidase CysQ [Hyunsoonleella aestuarii]|uniref:3'(2'),5'-bisphosphate nucleotidase CysQ n=1 Tax=Hyunsoonleella aestuarii TaxID=912802 RepID=A0ABP8E791_9FLAO|nr:3'(2'),5'-bisphosphate nucleotidase CysQ [Hyunsoonleella aestuarii]